MAGGGAGGAPPGGGPPPPPPPLPKCGKWGGGAGGGPPGPAARGPRPAPPAARRQSSVQFVGSAPEPLHEDYLQSVGVSLAGWGGERGWATAGSSCPLARPPGTCWGRNWPLNSSDAPPNWIWQGWGATGWRPPGSRWRCRPATWRWWA